MHFSARLMLASLGFIGSLAAPSPAELSARACTTIFPTSYQQISQAHPAKSYARGREFNVSQAAGGTGDFDSLVRFTGIPAGSYGCQVAMSFTYQYPIHSSGNAQLAVYSLANTIRVADSYSTYFPGGGRGTPANAYLWATTTVTGGIGVLNSKACSANMGFLFQIANDVQAGAVSFLDAGNNPSGISGFYMTYNC